MKDNYTKEVKKIYNSWAKKYKEQTKDIIIWNIFQIFLENIKWKKILDVCCWFWRDSLYFYKLWYEISWIDISEWLINEADESIKDKLVVWDALELEKYYKNNSFDWIWCAAWIVHMEKIFWLEVLKKIYKTLKRWGIFFLGTKLKKNKEIVEKESISIPWTYKKYVYYEESEIIDILKDIWFEIIYTDKQIEEVKDSWIRIICKK